MSKVEEDESRLQNATVEDMPDSDDEDERPVSSGMKAGYYSPPPFSRARTSPAAVQAPPVKSYLPVNESKPSNSVPTLTQNFLSNVPSDGKSLDKFLKDSATVGRIPTRSSSNSREQR
jgi:hypothetical protein